MLGRKSWVSFYSPLDITGVNFCHFQNQTNIVKHQLGYCGMEVEVIWNDILVL